MAHGGHGAALFLGLHHHQRPGEGRDEAVALQKAVGTHRLTFGRVLADDAAPPLDGPAEFPVGGGVGPVDGDAHHRDGGAVLPYRRPVSGAVQSVGQTAHDNSPRPGEAPPNILCGPQTVFGGLPGPHHSHSSRLIEPAGVAGAVEHQRHIGDAGEGQRIVRVVVGQDADAPGRAPPRKGPVVLGGVIRQAGALDGGRSGSGGEGVGVPGLPCLLRPAEGVQHGSGPLTARAQRPRQPEPAQERVGGRVGREKAQLPLPGPRHRLSSRKCQSRMLPAMPAFRLSTRSVMGMRTVPVQAAMVSSVRP